MQVVSISIQNFRSINLKNIDFSSPITIFSGRNNAGKTSILEALYFCSNLNSFKPVNNQDLITNNHKFFKISLNFSQNELKYNIFIEKGLKSAKSTLNNKKTSKKSLSSSFPCYSLVFGFNNILLNDSSYRREFIDSGMIHVNPEAHKLVSLYSKTLKQRNFVLKSGQNNNLDFWNKELVSLNTKLDSARYNYFQLLHNEYKDILANLEQEMPSVYDEISSISIKYKKGWNNDFKEELSSVFQKDSALGYTSIGTHRSDIEISSKGKLVRESGSMSTLVMSCLIIYLANIRVFHVKHGFKPLLLIDDLFFGIDNKNLDTVIKLLVYSNSNIVMTAPNIYKEILEKISKVNEKISIHTVGEG